MDLNSNAVGLDLWGQTAEKSIFLAILFLIYDRYYIQPDANQDMVDNLIA